MTPLQWPNFPPRRHGQKSHVWCLLISPCAGTPERRSSAFQPRPCRLFCGAPVPRQIGPPVLYVKLPAGKHRPSGRSAKLLCCCQTVLGSHCLSRFAFWERKRWQGSHGRRQVGKLFAFWDCCFSSDSWSGNFLLENTFCIFLWFVLPIKGSNGDNATPSLCGRDYFAKSITDLVRRGNCCEGSVSFLLNEHRSWANRSCRFLLVLYQRHCSVRPHSGLLG